MLRTGSFTAFLIIAAVAVMPVDPAIASPGPPPPDYIVEAAKHVVPTQTAATIDGYAADLANDLTVWRNGELAAPGKAAWLAIERDRLGKVDRRVIGYVEGYDSILVIDQFDDRSDVPDTPDAIFDPRYKTRAVRYQFGADHRIHSIRITQTDGILQRPS